MGWWDEDGYRVGDTVADYLTDMLKTIGKQGDAEGQNLAMDVFMGYLIQAINDNQKLFSDKEQLPVKTMSARLSDKKEINVRNLESYDETISKALNQTLKSIADVFQSTFDELPSSGDLMANLEFVLSKPADYLSIAPVPADSSLWSFNI